MWSCHDGTASPLGLSLTAQAITLLGKSSAAWQFTWISFAFEDVKMANLSSSFKQIAIQIFPFTC